MLVYILLQVPLLILSGILYIVPKVDTLPFGVDVHLVNGFGYIQFIMTFIPPIGLMVEAFLFVIGFKIALKLVMMVPFIGRMFR